MSIESDLIAAFNDGYAKGRAAGYEECKSELKTCRNELCLKCGAYREKHKGACDGCRWGETGVWS